MNGLNSVPTVEVANALSLLLKGTEPQVTLGGAEISIDRGAIIFGSPGKGGSRKRFALPEAVRANLMRRGPEQPLRPDLAAHLDGILRRAATS